MENQAAAIRLREVEELGSKYCCHCGRREEEKCHDSKCLHTIAIPLYDATVVLSNQVEGLQHVLLAQGGVFVQREQAEIVSPRGSRWLKHTRLMILDIRFSRLFNLTWVL